MFRVIEHALLAQMHKETGRRADALIRRLVDEVEFAGRREHLGSGLDIFIGRTLLQRSEQTINVSAREKAASFASINSKLGVVRKGALTESIRAAYANVHRP